MSSGSSARKLANTSARMTSAPTEPIIASAMIPVPLDEDGCAVGQQLRRRSPRRASPAGSGRGQRRWSIAGPRSAPPKPVDRRRVHQRERGPPVPGHERRVPASSRSRRSARPGIARASAANARPAGRGHRRVGDPLPGRHGDHRHVRGLRAAVAVLAAIWLSTLNACPGMEKLLVIRWVVPLIVITPAAATSNPEQRHERLVAEYEAGERWHRDLRVSDSGAGGRSASCCSSVPPRAPAASSRDGWHLAVPPRD